MHSPIRHEVLDFTIHVASLMRPVVTATARHDRELASQIRRATSSFVLNIAEAFGTKKGTERVQFENALGSLYEARAGVRLAVAWRYVAEGDTLAVVVAMDRLSGRVFGLKR